MKTALGPDGTPRAHVGDMITNSIFISNFDDYGDTITVTNIADIVRHGTGDVITANLLMTSVVLDSYLFGDPGFYIEVTSIDIARPTDPDYLFDKATFGGTDNRDGSALQPPLNSPQGLAGSTLAQLFIVRPGIQVTSIPDIPTNGLDQPIAYIGSVSNCGNTVLTNVFVSNFVDSAFAYVLGPTTLNPAQGLNFTNSYLPLTPGETNVLFVWGTDELLLTVTNYSTHTAPPLSIQSPTNGAGFTAPANITLVPSFPDEGAIQRVEFFVGTNFIGRSLDIPFTLTWSNVPAGSYTLIAKETDKLWASADSDPVNVTVYPPGPPAFSFQCVAYSVDEGDAAVTVTVAKNSSVAANVDYSTSDGTAIDGQDYVAQSGSLNFTNGEAFKTITVPIIDDLLPEPDKTFTLTLATNEFGTLSQPWTTTITIHDNDTNGLSSLVFAPPGQPPDVLGSLTVILGPTNADGQWRLRDAADASWQDSGTQVTNLEQGNYFVEYKPADGFITPEGATNSVLAGQPTSLTNSYSPSGDIAPSGWLTVSILPSNLTPSGQWRRQGEADWHQSGETVSNLNAGVYIVEFDQVPGWVTPSLRAVTVFSSQGSGLTAIYLLAGGVVGEQPGALDFTQIKDPVLPFGYNGQIRSDIGYGSGFVVTQKVVLTAAHVLFDDVSLSYVTGVRWYFQRHKGDFEPYPMAPRGSYLFEGYASQRANDIEFGVVPPGTSTPQSQNLDVAALYFFELAGRGGFGGYLASDSANNEWLLGCEAKVLVGYPVVDPVPLNNRGRMHASSLGRSFSFYPVSGHVFGTTNIASFAGNSGGPLYVQHGASYYPAGIYLGGTDQTLVRAIDSKVVDLIDRAGVSANGGDNNTGGGVITLVFGSGSNACTAYYQVQIGPAQAVQVGAAWRVQGETSWRTSPQSTGYLESGGTVALEFKPIDGWCVPVTGTAHVACNQDNVIPAQYQRLGFLAVNLGPADALKAGAGWRLQGETDYFTSTNTTLGMTNLGSFVIEFTPVQGWIAPTNGAGTVELCETNVVEALYQPINPVLHLTSGSNLVFSFSGTTPGTTYRIESSSDLGATNTWAVVTNVYLLDPATGISVPTPTNSGQQFYRAVWRP